ncbi:MAG: carboxypeptidase regulatory-like domain-containing protein [Terriglobia bacterium]
MKHEQSPLGILRSLCRGTGGWVLPVVLMAVILAFITPPTSAQVTSGSLTGVVSDPSGAVIPGAKVGLKDESKGYDYPATTDSVGRYLFTNLLPSTYSLTVEAGGFKTYRRKDIVIAVGTRLSADVMLEIGATAQSVEVTGAVAALSTQDAVTGQEVNRAMINDLPLVGRAVFDLAFLAPGVIQAPGATFGPSNNGNNFSSNGGRNAITEVLVDGVSATSYEPNTAINTLLYTPSVDAVQEFKIMQNNYTAEEGFTGNTYINVVLRSGTNNFHGSVYEFLRNDKLDANNWFTNQAGGKIPPLRRNQYGGTFGGPIKQDRTFFFFDWDGTREHGGATHNAGVPSAAERLGDFSEICTAPDMGSGTFDANGICSNGDHQLWDPYSGIYVAGTGRQLTVPIPYNNLATYMSSTADPNIAANMAQLPAQYRLAQVPGNLIDPVSAKMIQYFPMPNLGTPGTASYDRYNNWTASGVNTSRNDQFDIRIDHRFTDATTFNARYSHAWGQYHNMNCFGNALDTCTQGPGIGGSRSVALNLNHTFSPTTLLSVSAGFTRGLSDTGGIARDFPNFNAVTDLGMPDYINATGDFASPVIYLYGGYATVAGGEALGAQAWSIYKNGNQVYHLLSTLTHMHGRHELKFGGEFRVNRMNWYQVGPTNGLTIFDQFSTSEYPWWGGGDALASFLTGTGSGNQWGEYEIASHFSTQNFRWGGFVQDNWRATDKLTVNIGLRYDLEIPRTERYNRGANLDPTLSIPIQPAAVDPDTWPSILGPVPDVTNPTGGVVFLSDKQRRIVDTHFNNFGPRLSLAYRFLPSTVFRAGYGLFYMPTEFGTSGAGLGGTDGFMQVTNWNQTLPGKPTVPWGRQSDPFPGGPLMPTGSSLGALTNLGVGITDPLRDVIDPPYMQTWSAGIQRELPGNWLLDVNYVGTKGTHLYFHSAGNMDYFGPWIENMATDSALREALGTYVPNPYYGVITTPGSGITGQEIAASQLLHKYPQFTGVNQYFPPWANSIYHAFQLRMEKRMSNGLAVLVTYTNSKSIDDASVSTYTEWLGGFGQLRNPNNRKLERAVSEWDIPQVFQVGYLYQLPFGKGKRWGSGWNSVVNAILGGWQTNGIWRFDNGQPIHLGMSGGTSPDTYGGQLPNVTGKLIVNPKSMWFTDGYFMNAESVIQFPDQWTIGNAPRMMPDVRLPGTKNAALSLFKEVSLNKLREGSRLEFRVETFNALNHPQFGNVNTTFNNEVSIGNRGAQGFGNVQSQVNTPREVQLALKFYF